MAIPCGINTLNQQSFVECPEGSGRPARAVKICNPDEIAPVPELPNGYTSINEYGNVTAVPNATVTDIVTFTVPVGKKLILAKVEVSGDNIARYQIDIGGSVEAVRRGYWCDFNADFTWDRFELAAGTTIKVQVEQTGRPTVGEYDARIIGIEGPA